MSYKDYSEEAVKEILRKVSQSSRSKQSTSQKELIPDYPDKADQKNGFGADKIQLKDYAYNHPTTAESNQMDDTHIIIKSALKVNFPMKLSGKK